MLSFLLTFGLLRIGVEAFNGSASPNQGLRKFAEDESWPALGKC
jgi:hypothetical protein